MNLDLTEQIGRLKPGGHLCLFYDQAPSERMSALLPFIRAALENDERFVYIADDQALDALSGELERGGIDVDRETHAGRLRLYTRREWRQPGNLDCAGKTSLVRQYIAEANQAGFKGIRFAVEMTWTLGPDINLRELEHWEASVNTLFDATFPGRMLCQYNRGRLSPETLLVALHTHPEAVLGSDVYPNPFYEAPLILNSAGNGHQAKGKSAAARVDWMFSQLERVRAAEMNLRDLDRERAARAEAEAAKLRADTISHRLSAIVESSDDAIVSKDLNGIIATWNRGAERIFGYTAQEAIGRPITMLIPPERHSEEAEILRRIRNGQRIEHYETIRRHKSGALLHISLTISPVRDSEGRIVGASKIARDITARKQSEAELQAARDELVRLNSELEERVRKRTASLAQAIAQMQEFSYTVSHDLRAPARCMKSYAKIVLDDFGQALPPEARDLLDRVIRGGERMDRLIQDVLTYSRLSRRELDLRPISLHRLVHDIIHQFPEMQPPRAFITLRTPLLDVHAHEPSLAQALSNLLSNAIKFMPPGEVPRVTVRTESQGEQVRIWVEDNGIGIKPEHQHRIFGVFERLPAGLSYEGTGIGLAIVRKAAERMGGVAGVVSDGLTGSRFWIDLPQAQSHGNRECAHSAC